MMDASPLISRDPQAAAAASWDLIVVGGGIQGAALALEASRRGQRALLIERGDFGCATSGSSLRILHGGLRYLQSLDLQRFRESVAERRWFLRHFPDLAEPLPCLMPLYDPPRGGRLRRTSAFRLALAANDVLSRRRNEGIRADRWLPEGRVLDAAETLRFFPGADRQGLRGGALWYDGYLPDPQRLLIEMLRWACSLGAQALHRIEASELMMEKGRVTGLRAVDHATGRSLELASPTVMSCAGPWSRALAARFDRDLPELFRPVLAFNVLLDREPPSRCAVAVAAPGPGAQTWFLTPFGAGQTLAGTCYVQTGAAGLNADLGTGPREEDVAAFLGQLDAALPGFGARGTRVSRVLHGWLPAVAEGSPVPASRPVIHDHGAAGGPEGLFSVSGVKLTTARAVAERALARVFARRGTPLPAIRPGGRPLADPLLTRAEPLALAGMGGRR